MSDSSEPIPLTAAFDRLFSAVGEVGCGATEAPVFRAPADLLMHMNRLAVTHSLVTHAAARDVHPTDGNRRLLDDLEACAAARGRLHPALVVTPTQQWERDGIAELRRAMSNCGSRALRACPGTLRYRLFQLQHVLEQVQDFNPFLTVDIREVPEPLDIVRLAEALPTIPIVCTQGMWGHLTTLFDLMQRCGNVLLETSWLHVWDVIADAAQRFGAHRVLFGLGPPAHQGAAIAGLAHAPIDEAERRRIAWENLAELMQLPEGGPVIASRPAPPFAKKAPAAGVFWRQFIEGKSLPVDVVDAHGHLGGIATWSLRELDIERQIQCALARMDRLGIDMMIISGAEALFSDPVEGNRRLADRLRPHGGRLQAYIAFNPHYHRQLADAVDDLLADPVFVGFKLLCDYWNVPVTDDRFTAVWEHAHAHRLPILLHTWDTANNSPRMLTDIVPRYPQACFLLGHSGGGDRGRREAEALAGDHPNVYLEWCGSFCCRIPWEQTLEHVDPRRVVFGTDGVYHDLSWELGRLLSLNVPDEIIEPILGQNMRRILAVRR